MLAATLHHPVSLNRLTRRMEGSSGQSHLPLRCCVLLGHSFARKHCDDCHCQTRAETSRVCMMGTSKSHHAVTVTIPSRAAQGHASTSESPKDSARAC